MSAVKKPYSDTGSIAFRVSRCVSLCVVTIDYVNLIHSKCVPIILDCRPNFELRSDLTEALM